MNIKEKNSAKITNKNDVKKIKENDYQMEIDQKKIDLKKMYQKKVDQKKGDLKKVNQKKGEEKVEEL